MNGDFIFAIFLGVALGGGIFLIITARSPRSLEARLAPWVADVSIAAAEALSTRRADRNSQPLARRISLACKRWGGVHLVMGALAGLLVGVLGVLAGSMSVPAAIGLAIAGGVVGVIGERALRLRARTRNLRIIAAELPAVCDLLALSLAAGESFLTAITRASEHGTGPVSSQLREVITRVESGDALATALGGASERLGSPLASRVFGHITLGLERGTPLASVLRTQAQDARADAARTLQERASAREVIMLIPLVFVILPVTVAFAVYPGLLAIQAGY